MFLGWKRRTKNRLGRYVGESPLRRVQWFLNVLPANRPWNKREHFCRYFAVRITNNRFRSTTKQIGCIIRGFGTGQLVEVVPGGSFLRFL